VLLAAQIPAGSTVAVDGAGARLVRIKTKHAGAAAPGFAWTEQAPVSVSFGGRWKGGTQGLPRLELLGRPDHARVARRHLAQHAPQRRVVVLLRRAAAQRVGCKSRKTCSASALQGPARTATTPKDILAARRDRIGLCIAQGTGRACGTPCSASRASRAGTRCSSDASDRASASGAARSAYAKCSRRSAWFSCHLPPARPCWRRRSPTIPQGFSINGMHNQIREPMQGRCIRTSLDAGSIDPAVLPRATLPSSSKARGF